MKKEIEIKIANLEKCARLEKYKIKMSVKRLESNMDKIIAEDAKVHNKNIVKLKEELKALRKEARQIKIVKPINTNKFLDEFESDWDKFICA